MKHEEAYQKLIERGLTNKEAEWALDWFEELGVSVEAVIRGRSASEIKDILLLCDKIKKQIRSLGGGL